LCKKKESRLLSRRGDKRIESFGGREKGFFAAFVKKKSLHWNGRRGGWGGDFSWNGKKEKKVSEGGGKPTGKKKEKLLARGKKEKFLGEERPLGRKKKRIVL